MAGRSHFIQNTLWKALPTKQKYAHFTYQKPGKNLESATNPGHRLPLPLSHRPPPPIAKPSKVKKKSTLLKLERRLHKSTILRNQVYTAVLI